MVVTHRSDPKANFTAAWPLKHAKNAVMVTVGQLTDVIVELVSLSTSRPETYLGAS